MNKYCYLLILACFFFYISATEPDTETRKIISNEYMQEPTQVAVDSTESESIRERIQFARLIVKFLYKFRWHKIGA